MTPVDWGLVDSKASTAEISQSCNRNSCIKKNNQNRNDCFDDVVILKEEGCSTKSVHNPFSQDSRKLEKLAQNTFLLHY